MPQQLASRFNERCGQQGCTFCFLPHHVRTTTMEHTDDNTTLIGTISGTLLSVIAMFDAQDILKTIIMAAIGAAVSFLVTKILKWLFDLF